jgi:hypothetical protein
LALGGALAGVLMSVGFGVEGIMAESFAAIWQSAIGNVAKISSFALF